MQVLKDLLGICPLDVSQFKISACIYLIPSFILMFISSKKESYCCCGITMFLIGRQEKEAVGSIFIFYLLFSYNSLCNSQVIIESQDG